jgi:L-lactate utilization protein LutB
MEQLNETVSKAKNIEDGLRRALSEKESEIQMRMLSVD